MAIPRRFGLVIASALLLAGCAGADDEDNDQGAAGATPTTQPPDTTAASPTNGTSAPGGGIAAVPAVVDDVQPSVVAVVTPAGQGSGVIYNADGTIVTNFHVIEPAQQEDAQVEVVFASGDREPADIVATDEFTDLAVLSVDVDDLPAAEFQEGIPDVGELAVAVGNPLGFEFTVTAGVISGVHRSFPDPAQGPALADLIQTDAPISPGNSGGALADSAGQVLGVTVAYIPPQTGAQSLGFAIPAATVVDVVDQLLDDGEAEHAFLGVQPATLTPQVAERFGLEVDRGVVVLGVTSGGPAEQADIRTGDVIVEADGEAVDTAGELLTVLRGLDPGDEITLGILRDGTEEEISVDVADRPTS